MYVLIGITLIILILIYYKVVENNDYWLKRKVPHEKPAFWFGNLKQTIYGTKHFGEVYCDLYRKFKQYPYIGYFKLKEPGIIINDPELIRNVIVKDFNYFSDNDFRVDPETDPIWASNVFSQSGEQWKKTRSAWTYGMTTSKIKAMFEDINEKCDTMIDYIKRETKNNPGKPLEVRIMSSKFFTDVIVACMLGLKVNSFECDESEYSIIARSMFSSTFGQRFITLTFLIAPWLGKIFKIRFVSKDVEKKLLQLSRKILQDRNKNGYQKNNPFDSMIMHSDYKEGVTEIQVAGFLFGSLLDGTETSSGVSAYALYCLAKYPHIQEKLRKEIEVLTKAAGGKLSYDDIHQAPYLDMVLSETMRIYPASLVIQRLCTKEYTLPPQQEGGPEVKLLPDMPLIVPTYALHMDPEYFPDPEKFDPERFSAENKDRITKYTYMPFGEGPRICLGIRLAMNQIKIGMVAIIKNFEIRLAPEMIGKELTIDPNIFVMRNVAGFWLTFHQRNTEA